jgi:hypothetical protein
LVEKADLRLEVVDLPLGVQGGGGVGWEVESAFWALA